MPADAHRVQISKYIILVFNLILDGRFFFYICRKMFNQMRRKQRNEVRRLRREARNVVIQNLALCIVVNLRLKHFFPQINAPEVQYSEKLQSDSNLVVSSISPPLNNIFLPTEPFIQEPCAEPK